MSLLYHILPFLWGGDVSKGILKDVVTYVGSLLSEPKIVATNKEVRKLKADNERMKADNERMKADNERMKAEMKRMKAEMKRMKEDNEGVREELREIKALLGDGGDERKASLASKRKRGRQGAS